MQTGAYIAFIVTSVLVLVFPGPSILLIVANSLQRGVVIGLYTVAGGLVAMVVQLVVALVGLQSLISYTGVDFNHIRWLGVAYLLYLGARRWQGAVESGAARGPAGRRSGMAVVEGFVVALTNPGTLLFFVAFFPQFVEHSAPMESQLWLLAVTFMVLTTLVDTSYALLAARLGDRLHEPRGRRQRNRLSGILLMLAALCLAIVRV